MTAETHSNDPPPALPRCTRVLAAGDYLLASVAGSVTLSFGDRHRRRLRLVSDQGMAFLLDLAQATVLAEGDGLALDHGGIVRVRAAEERVVQVTAPTPLDLLRYAWHLGNRHLPTEIHPDRLLIGDDPVIIAMLQGLGASVERLTVPFSPEQGAYAGERGGHAAAQPGHGHGHSHSHDGQDHDHDHGHHHDHAHQTGDGRDRTHG